MRLFPSRPDDGLPALGAILLLAVAVYLAALVELAVTGTLGWLLGVVLVGGSACAGARVVRRDLAFAVIAPPLAFAAGVFAAVPFTAASRQEGFPLGIVLAFAGALGSGAPLLLAAVAVAGALAALRWQRGRRAAEKFDVCVGADLVGGADVAADAGGSEGTGADPVSNEETDIPGSVIDLTGDRAADARETDTHETTTATDAGTDEASDGAAAGVDLRDVDGAAQPA